MVTDYLKELELRMNKLSLNEDAMFVEHQLADNLLEILKDVTLSEHDKLNKIISYCSDENNFEYELDFMIGQDILTFLNKN